MARGAGSERKGLMAAAALAALGGAGGALEHTGPVADGVAGVAALRARCEPVGFDVAGVQPLARCEALGAGVPGEAGIGGLAQGLTLAGLPGYAALAGAAEAVAGGAPGYSALAGSLDAMQVNPFLGPLDVWGEGPLGMLARKGLEARDRGDYAGFEQLQSLYWERMTAALERRRVLGGGREDAGR